MPQNRPTDSAIDDAAVARVARLSRLELTDDERRLFGAQLGGILDSFRRLAALALPPEADAAAGESSAGTLREDVVVPSLPLEDVLANAPAVEDGCFVVPPVIEAE